MSSSLTVAACVTLAVLLWPRRAAVTYRAVRFAALSPPVPAIAHRRSGARARRRAEAATVAEALRILDTVGPALRMGLRAEAALGHLAQAASSREPGGGLTAELIAAAGRPGTNGGNAARASPVGQAWARAATHTGAEELRLVAAAWTLADTCGVPLAGAVELAGRLLRESRARQARLGVLLAGPRATIVLLTSLPLAGPVVGLLFGIDPVSLYAGSVLTVLSTACGLGLLLVGRVWSRRLVRTTLSAATAGTAQSTPQV